MHLRIVQREEDAGSLAVTLGRDIVKRLAVQRPGQRLQRGQRLRLAAQHLETVIHRPASVPSDARCRRESRQEGLGLPATHYLLHAQDQLLLPEIQHHGTALTIAHGLPHGDQSRGDRQYQHQRQRDLHQHIVWAEPRRHTAASAPG